MSSVRFSAKRPLDSHPLRDVKEGDDVSIRPAPASAQPPSFRVCRHAWLQAPERGARGVPGASGSVVHPPPPPLGLSQPLGPVRLFYSPGLMRAFNFSFTSSLTPTFNNTPCARQKFAPGHHGFDHKTTAGRRAWLTLSALQAVWSPALREIRCSSSEVLAADRELSEVLLLLPTSFLPLGGGRFRTGRGTALDCREVPCNASLAFICLPPLPFDRPTNHLPTTVSSH